jgi:hypothetical protein
VSTNHRVKWIGIGLRSYGEARSQSPRKGVRFPDEFLDPESASGRHLWPRKIKEGPIAVGGQGVIFPMMDVALSCDHRVVNGREAVPLLAKVREFTEASGALLPEEQVA